VVAIAQKAYRNEEDYNNNIPITTEDSNEAILASNNNYNVEYGLLSDPTSVTLSDYIMEENLPIVLEPIGEIESS
jgi:hypothetical protein